MTVPRKEVRKTERFHQIPIFSNLAGKEVGEVLRMTKELKFKPGEEIFKPGDPCNGFYIILDGRVDIRLTNDSGKTHTTIATLSHRSVFGEMSFLGKRPRSALAVAVDETRLNHVDGEAFQASLDRGDVSAYKVIHNFAILIAGRLRRVEDELLDVLQTVGPEKRKEKLAELQEFRHTLYRDWSF